MSEVLLRIDDEGVSAADSAASAPFGSPATPDGVWRAALAVLADTTAGAGPDDPVDGIRIESDTQLLAVWDLETLGSPTGLLDVDAVARLATDQPHLWALVEAGRYAIGPIDSYLLARMTRGVGWATATEVPGLADVDLPLDAQPTPSRGVVGRSDAASCGVAVPITLG